jgi:hypothetical protein
VFQDLITECAENFGEPPREFSIWDRLTYWRVVRPKWLQKNPNDELETLFLNMRNLREDGRVVWGHIVQANSLLFSPGIHDCPAEVVYSLDDSNPIGPEELGEIASALYALKNTEPDDPALATIAHHQTDELSRFYGKPVPRSISPRYKCRISTIYILRKHLPEPGRYLQLPFFPIIVYPAKPYVTLPLPSRYWPDELVEWWTSTE